VGNVQRALETIFCEAPGCPEDAAPDARFCTRHMRARVIHLDCSYWRCDLRAEPDSIFCEAHGLLEEARAHPPAERETLERAAVFAASAPQTKEPDVEPFEKPPCRIDGCANLAAPITIGARRQGGRYDMCQEHLDALTEKARETRRRNREAAQGVSPPPARAEEPGAAGSPAGESTETAPPQNDGAVSPLRWLACTRIYAHEPHEWQSNSTDVGACYCPGVPEEREALPGEALPPLLQQPQPGDVELPCERDDEPQAAPLPLSPFDLDENLEPLISTRVPRMLRPPEGERDFGHAIAVAGIIEREPGRFAFGTPNGPQRDLTWAERALVLADVGRAIDDLEVELEQARARWRALASPE
jgi:hypothetical protein